MKQLTDTQFRTLAYLAERLDAEADHLAKYPGSITCKTPYSQHTVEERAAIREELKEIRSRYKVISATHTEINLRRWARAIKEMIADE